MTFAYTPQMVRWIRAHADKMNSADMAQHVGCAVDTLLRVCRSHGIVLCRESDQHADLKPLPGEEAETVPLAPAVPTVHPRLNPALRANLHAGFLELRPGKGAIAVIDRKAAALRTTPAVLCAVLLEIIAHDNMFDNILDLD